MGDPQSLWPVASKNLDTTPPAFSRADDPVPYSKKDLYTSSSHLTSNEFLIIFRKHYEQEIQARIVARNYQIFTEARRQIGMILPWTTDAPAIALKILSGLTPTHMALLSSATSASPRGCLNSGEWKEDQKLYFCTTFTSFVPGPWEMSDILGLWEELVKAIMKVATPREKVLAMGGGPVCVAQLLLIVWHNLMRDKTLVGPNSNGHGALEVALSDAIFKADGLDWGDDMGTKGSNGT